MGMLQGKTIGDTFVVIDCFPLPVEGTETRVSAHEEAYAYLVDFMDTSKVLDSRYLKTALCKGLNIHFT
jgi:COP9 signalosome complex subunit 5